jgi:hypothetical protein
MPHKEIHMKHAFTVPCTSLALAALLALTLPAHAVDGVKLIDMARVAAGGVTPGDTPGFPVTISQPGSYRLSGNLTVPDANTDAIVVTEANVTLDLNGFAILGPTTCVLDFGPRTFVCSPTGTGEGISNGSGPGSISPFLVVMNGTIRGMGANGINIQNAGLGAVRIEKVAVSDNGGSGIVVVGEAMILHNSVFLNGGVGIFNNSNGLVLGNIVNNNKLGGLELNASVGYTKNIPDFSDLQSD